VRGNDQSGEKRGWKRTKGSTNKRTSNLTPEILSANRRQVYPEATNEKDTSSLNKKKVAKAEEMINS
jgi:hypothetical protein